MSDSTSRFHHYKKKKSTPEKDLVLQHYAIESEYSLRFSPPTPASPDAVTSARITSKAIPPKTPNQRKKGLFDIDGAF